MAEFPFVEVAGDPERFRLYVVKTLAHLEASAATSARQLEKLERDLFGNGQPGLIDQLDKKIGVNSTAIVRWRGVIVGVSIAISAFGVLVSLFLQALKIWG